MADLKNKVVLVFLPNGKAIEIQPERARLTTDKDGLIRRVDEIRQDGSVRRFEGFPGCLETHPPSLIESATSLPPGLVRGSH